MGLHFRFKKLFLRGMIAVIMLMTSAFAESLSYSGRLVNSNGSPVTGSPTLFFELAYSGATGAILCTDTVVGVNLTNGVFHVALDFDCSMAGKPFEQVMAEIPADQTAAIRVTNGTKVYSFQAIHSVPSAKIAYGLSKLNANTNEVLTWTGSKWEPKAVSGATGGTVTSVGTGSGLTGGPFTTSGTISIANSGVTDSHLAGNIARSKLANGTANYVLVNDGSGVMSEVAQLPLTSGGTGATTAAAARTNLGLGTLATVSQGGNWDQVLTAALPTCLPGQILTVTSLPTVTLACVADASVDNSKLPLTGGTMSGVINMGSNTITNLPDPTNDSEVATKKYVDLKSGGGAWTVNGTAISNTNTGNVGIGVLAPAYKLDVNGDINITGNFKVNGINISTSGNSPVGAFGGMYSNGAGTFASQNNPYTSGKSCPAGFTPRGLGSGGYQDASNNFASFDFYYCAANGGAGGTAAGLNGQMQFNSSGLLAGANMYYVGSDVGIGTLTPSEKLDVAGNIALTGRLRLKSDNANYVELKAPASLASTLTLNFPGTNGSSGQALITDGSGNLSWSTISATGTSVGGDLTGTVANAQISAGAIIDADISGAADIAQSKISGLTTDLSNKEPKITAGTASQYLKGDKTWGTFITDVLASTFATVTTSNAVIANGDSLQTVVNKTQGQINALKSADNNFLVKNGTDTITGAVSVSGSLKIAATPSGVDLTDVANVQYVQNYVGIFGQWTKNGSHLYYDSGAVSVGTNSPTGPNNIETKMKILRPLNKWGLTIEGEGMNQADIMLVSPGSSANNRVGQIVNTIDKMMIRSINDDATIKQTLLSMMHTTGYVGVGTVTPQRPLHVSQSAAAGGNTAPVMIERVNSSGTPAANELTMIQYKMPNSSGAGIVGADMGATLTDVTPGSEKGALIFRTSPNGGSTIPERMRIDSNGNVGIGLTVPDSKLHVLQTVDSVAGGMRISNTANTATAAFYVDTNDQTHLGGATASPDAIIIKNVNGNVGLGIAPLTKLHIGGGDSDLVIDGVTPISIHRSISYPAVPGMVVGGSAYVSEGSGASTNIWPQQAGVLFYAGEVHTAAKKGTGISFTTTPNGTTSAVDRMVITPDGKVGIGTTSPSTNLTVNSNVATGYTIIANRNSAAGGQEWRWYSSSTGAPLGTDSMCFGLSACILSIYATGNATLSGTLTQASDIRLKHEINSIPYALDAVTKLDGVTYYWKDSSKGPDKQIGLIAQNVEKVFPEAVQTDKQGMKSVAYQSLVAPIINAIKEIRQWMFKTDEQSKEVKREIASIKAENKAKNEEIEKLKRENAEMKARLDRIEQSLRDK
ncbi:tail fiber domain-containing protein [Peredibacter sp. HCB2-198]|uniref:tail fiber domain-containing protein n=1 Tax=Peredibacter sp. HCB2-198 TaxID=3383025 RepID=UPI0038B51503